MSMQMTAREKLDDLLRDVFLLDDDALSGELRRADLDTWDSLGTVSLAVGVEEVFGYHMAPDEAGGLGSVGDLIALLRTKGIEIE
jgi:acyl carrier protein